MNEKISLADVFKNNLRKDARTVSVATLLSDRYLRRIKYDPYYQRNYVWEKEKQSFFIESIFLGTEIPPIVFYKHGTKVEVIDGRQRFETLKRFRENDFSLNQQGLMTLKALKGKRYKNMEEFQQLFDDTKIRIFEFEIVGMPDVSPELEDKVKKEIFRRYNSGITPLNQSEVDNAKYTDDAFTDHYKQRLKEDKEVYDLIKECFFSNSNKRESELIVDMAAELRKLLVLSHIPISRYADSGKNALVEMLYDKYISDLTADGINIEEVEEQLLKDIKTLRSILPSNANNFVYECMVWAIEILRDNGINENLTKYENKIKSHFEKNYSIYNTDSDHYYMNIVNRFKDTTNLINEIVHFDFQKYISDSTFSQKVKDLQQTEVDAELTMDKLSNLRISKPNPGSKPIDQLLSEIESERYLIRPAYQRQEKINVCKASSIIESILLGIKLPPLFIYVRQDNVREVIDGQQRLLTIIGFLGKKYKNEEGKMTTSNNDNFKLKGLRILTQYNNKRYSEIREEVEDAILDFDIDEIEIRQDINPEFEPTDLFIRLNNKPYPIRQNTFEMWNSFTERTVIQKIKEVTKIHLSWFYLTIPKFDGQGNPTDRMQNEELVTILSYLGYCHMRGEDFDKVLGFYPRLNKFTCRLKTKVTLTNILESLEDKPMEREDFIRAINKTEEIILFIKNGLLSGDATKDTFNNILDVKNLKSFVRTNQEFYILWEILLAANLNKAYSHVDTLLQDIILLLNLLKNTEEKSVDNYYVSNFIDTLRSIRNKYK